MSIVRATTQQGKRPLLYRGKKRLRRKARLLLVSLLTLSLLFVAWKFGNFICTTFPHTKEPGLLFLKKNGLPFPQDPINIFPISLPEATYPLFKETFFPSCLPNNIQEKDKTNSCQIPNDDYRNVVRIQTTPTITGQAAARLLEDFLQPDTSWEVNTRTFASNFLPEGWIVHLAVLPPLLEAMDLLLHVITKEEKKEGAWTEALEYTIQRILQHHCEFATAVTQQNKAVWSVSLNEVVGFPSMVLKLLYDFLEIREQHRQVSSSAAALTVLERTQYVITWLETNGSALNYRQWNERVDLIIETSIRRVTEANSCDLSPTPPNELARRVDAALLGTFDCAQYPSIGLCHHMLG